MGVFERVSVLKAVTKQAVEADVCEPDKCDIYRELPVIEQTDRQKQQRQNHGMTNIVDY